MSIELPEVGATVGRPQERCKKIVLFPLGRITATPGALDCCRRHNVLPMSLIARHQRGDWGDLTNDDIVANENALFSGGRLLSAFCTGSERLFVITEADHSATTLLKASEY